MQKFRRTLITAIAAVCAMVLMAGVAVDSVAKAVVKPSAAIESLVRIDNATAALIDNDIENYFDSSVVYKVADNVSEEQEISVIVEMNVDSVMDAYAKTDKSLTVADYASTFEARMLALNINKKIDAMVAKLSESDVEFEVGNRYDTLFSGFEITIKAKDYAKAGKLFENEATTFVGETYLPAATTIIVTNEVEVYDTGIFDSSFADSTGDGVVVAVLDSGLDYTHSVFSTDNFNAEKPAFTKEYVSDNVNKTVAATFTNGLTGDDVYVSEKIPFAYDYADRDADVLPTNSDHGTHVSGIIAGNNDVITGVAPDAQIAFMKVFSDFDTGAKTSWILAGLEDCVNLGVDVINMSLGSGCGFATERDKTRINEVYNKVEEAGISLIVAAGNDNISVVGSEKNGSLNLTSNPDAGVVGAPSTYNAALSVASVDGVPTPYFDHNGQHIYFNEASNASAEQLDFVDLILGEGVEEKTFTYVTIPGLGRSSDYAEDPSYYHDKIVLVKRGILTFEDKIKVALKEKGAAGIIIYNNVSGDISMSVGKIKDGAACSISQDDGELLAASGTGTIYISRKNTAGPYMSTFSSWGPTSGLQIKPEITAHGGEIYSAIPGEAYERQSGTSMASPNMAGATALIREHVKYNPIFGENLSAPANAPTVTAIVNQLAMSTTDIIRNKNGLPYAVRKQGSGLVNIRKALSSAAYLTTYDRDGNKMNRAKFEIGDDKNKEGVYKLKFDINNVSSNSISYDVNALVLSEGVSDTYTSHDELTVSQEGYELEASNKATVLSVEGAGTKTGNNVTVSANSTATVVVEIRLTDNDKAYLDKYFENGYFIEGFVTLTATAGTTVNMNAPFLGFYGDWTAAPIFDEEYFDTHADEVNDGLDIEDKLMPDAYATKVIGGLYDDYILYMGTYAFNQDPAATQIVADKEHIALSNLNSDANSAANNIAYIWAGLLRNVREAHISIVDDATGKEIWSKSEYNIRKSTNRGSFSPGQIDVDFKTLEHNLKNNSKYTVTVTTYIDYGENEDQKNTRNVFEFPLYIDFESPLVTDAVYRTEYDKTTKKNRLYADFYVYDNHYAMGMQLGQVTKPVDENSQYMFEMKTFGKYVTPIYSAFNSTNKVTVELTDYVADLKNSVAMGQDEEGNVIAVENSNTLVAICYDYALNAATYELKIPAEFTSLEFTQDSLLLNPNETKDLGTLLDAYPSDSWIETLSYSSSNPEVADVVNQTVIAKTSGSAVITVIGRDAEGKEHQSTIEVQVRKPGDEGYNGSYSIPKVNKFQIASYHVNKAYYSYLSSEREIGVTGGTYDFDGNYSLSMFPSESVDIIHKLDSYFMDRTSVTYQSSNRKIATVDENGTIVAQAEGTARITVTVMFDGSKTSFTGTISVKVKDPYTTNSIYLTSYKGLGGVVEIPDDRGITIINSYAFSNFEMVPKGPGDVIDDENPYMTKQQYLGEDTITKVIIPEGVKEIAAYAFAGLTALEEVVLPSTLTRIGLGAFLKCESLKTINLGYVKFINSQAFAYSGLSGVLDLTAKVDDKGVKSGDVLVAISDDAFRSCKLTKIILPKTAQSIGANAFYGNTDLSSVELLAPKVKIGRSAFASCNNLRSIDVNASVISPMAFRNCTSLTSVTLGRDVAVIGEFAFDNTNVSKFDVDPKNTVLSTREGGALVMSGKELVAVAPKYLGTALTVNLGDAEAIGTGAFMGNSRIIEVVAPNVTTIGDYAFSGCDQLKTFTFGKLTKIGNNAFEGTSITKTPDMTAVAAIGNYAFASSRITNVTIKDGAVIGDYAFAFCDNLQSVEIGSDVIVGNHAFQSNRQYKIVTDNSNIGNFDKYYRDYTYEVEDENGEIKSYTYYRYDMSEGVYSQLGSLTIGNNVKLGDYAFAGSAKLKTVAFGENVELGDYAFYDASGLTDLDLSTVTKIGEYAFSGQLVNDLYIDVENSRTLSPAIEYQIVDGKLTPVFYMLTSGAPALTKVDLTSATELGQYAFAGCFDIEELVIGKGLTTISEGQFARAALKKVVGFENVTTVEDQAFYMTELQEVDLSNVMNVGAGAFTSTELQEITLPAGAVIGDRAFDNCVELTTVNGLEKVKSIGAYAFNKTALTELNFVDVEFIGEFAFAETAVTKVTFGSDEKASALKEMGDNPFAACQLESFGKTVEGRFGDEIVETYDVNDTFKVIDGVLYEKVNTGLELVTYPVLKKASSYTVVDGTVRIGARAFEGNEIHNVTLSSTLRAIGHKAFYKCDNLGVVVFTGYVAPALEEEYDLSIFSMENLPFTGTLGDYEGLGIANYNMWNIGSSPNVFYYGANFVDYVGHVTKPIVMVKPVNGQNYDTFIFGTYFSSIVNGSTAAMDSTLEVIELIEKIPVEISLSDEAAIVAARTAYDKIPSLDQKALVTNYNKLTAAESLLNYIKGQIDPDDDKEPDKPVEPDDNDSSCASVMPVSDGGFGGGMALLLLSMAAFAVILSYKRKATK